MKKHRERQAAKDAAVADIDQPFATFPDGAPICVGRPANPELSVKLAKEALAANVKDPEVFNKIADRCGPHAFVGYLSRNRKFLVDKTGKRIGDLQPGDSFMDMLNPGEPFVEEKAVH